MQVNFNRSIRSLIRRVDRLENNLVPSGDDSVSPVELDERVQAVEDRLNELNGKVDELIHRLDAWTASMNGDDVSEPVKSRGRSKK